MSGRYGQLPDPKGGGSYNQRAFDDEEEDPRSYPLFKQFEDYVRRSFEGGTINTGVYCHSYEETANGIEVTLAAVQKANRDYRDRIEGFPGSPAVEAISDFDELQNREVHTASLDWPIERPSVTRIFSAPRRGVKLYDQPRIIILAMAATLFVSALSTTGEQWLLMGAKVGLL